jgi:transcriptional regulator with XRE-family HTH domain
MTVSDNVAARIRTVRKRLGWSLAELAAACAEADPSRKWTENTIENIEGGRRRGGSHRRAVTVDELFVLAAALNVSPVHLLVPIDDFRESYKVTSGISESAGYVREWIRGRLPLPGADPREFFSQVPRTEHDWKNEAVSWPAPTPPAPRDDQEGGA